jgi:hypothetical protein
MTAMLQRAFAHHLLRLSNNAMAVVLDDIVVDRSGQDAAQSQARER